MAKYDVILITGASSGIGAGLARHYLAAGATVGVCGRDQARLDAVCGGFDHAHPLVFDTTDRYASSIAIQRFTSAAGPIDLAILNAGTHDATDAASFELAAYERLMEINYIGALNSFAPIVDMMKQRRSGTIAFTGSAAGITGLPNAGAYCASKAAIASLAETLRVELEAFDVHVRLITPGFVRTPLTARNDFPMPFLLESDEAVDRIAKGLAGDSFEIAFPLRLILSMRLLALLPAGVRGALKKRMLPAHRATQ